MGCRIVAKRSRTCATTELTICLCKARSKSAALNGVPLKVSILVPRALRKMKQQLWSCSAGLLSGLPLALLARFGAPRAGATERALTANREPRPWRHPASRAHAEAGVAGARRPTAAPLRPGWRGLPSPEARATRAAGSSIRCLHRVSSCDATQTRESVAALAIHHSSIGALHPQVFPYLRRQTGPFSQFVSDNPCRELGVRTRSRPSLRGSHFPRTVRAETLPRSVRVGGNAQCGERHPVGIDSGERVRYVGRSRREQAAQRESCTGEAAQLGENVRWRWGWQSKGSEADRHAGDWHRDRRAGRGELAQSDDGGGVHALRRKAMACRVARKRDAATQSAFGRSGCAATRTSPAWTRKRPSSAGYRTASGAALTCVASGAASPSCSRCSCHTPSSPS